MILSVFLSSLWFRLSSANSLTSQFDAMMENTTLKSILFNLTSQPHIAGSQIDYNQAVEIKRAWLAAGVPSVSINEYFPLLCYPQHRSLRLQSPFEWTAVLDEESVTGDPTSDAFKNAVPSFLAYSPSGTVTSPIVYANYGRPSDFRLLEQQGIDVVGKIVLVRYGAAFRGLLVHAAQLAGASAVIIYSDPLEDGFRRGIVYPDGPFRPPFAVQRGSVQNPQLYAGDPLTPLKPALRNASRIALEDSNVPKIPCLPIGYGDAIHLLTAIEGSGMPVTQLPDDWKGGLNVSYWTGPSGLATLTVSNKFNVTPIWNVLGSFEGAVEPERTVIVGAHRDAWVFGAVDPSSAAAVHFQVGIALGTLYQNGWRPDRSLMLASWDAEEYGLVGSIEFSEEFSARLNATTVAYINIDSGVSGDRFSASASPSLFRLLRQVTRTVADPTTGSTVLDRWGGEIDALGFGSDYVPFLQTLGIASMDIRFTGDYGVYHSNYDSFTWMQKFGDPSFQYHATLGKIIGRLVFALVGNSRQRLPLFYEEYVDELQKHGRAVFDALQQNSFPDVWALVLAKSISHFAECVEQQQPTHPTVSVQRSSPSIDSFAIDETQFNNDALVFAERLFLDQNGLPGRAFYKHVIYSPGLWTGYKAQIFPSIHEAIGTRNVTAIQQAIATVSHRIHLVGEHLCSAVV